MFQVQGWLLLLCIALAGAADTLPVGEAGLAALAEGRGKVKAVAGTGERTVRRADMPDEPGDPRTVAFAVTAEGRYDIVLRDPGDPEGERTHIVCDGIEVVERMSLSADDQKPGYKRRKASGDMMQRLLACLRLDLAALRADYAIELKAAADGLRELKLVPTDPAMAKEITAISVILDAAGKPVRVLLRETSDNLQRLEVKTFVDDPEIDPARFILPAR